jgi:hypothetical protein
LSLDFSFANNQFVRLFTVTTSFDAALALETNGSGLVGFLKGTGYLISGQGNALHAPETLGRSSSESGEMFVSLFPPANLPRPTDFFGVHYDLTFPDNSSVDVTGGKFRLVISGGGPFGIGPGIRADIVPDIGDTLCLFSIGLGALGVLRSRMAVTA